MSNILSLENHSEVFESELSDVQSQGFVDAGKVCGSESFLGISLDNFYASFLLKAKRETHDIELKEKEYELEKERIGEKIQLNKNEIEKIKTEFLPEVETRLKNAENELSEFKANPDKFIKIEKDNLMLWFYGILSAALALFLFFFYSSVVYSAIFRDITITKTTLYESIFYSRAIEDAFSKGFTSGAVVVLSPFIFLTLGLILENRKRKIENAKSLISTAFAWIFVFGVDSLLAYHISDRIYNSKAINSYGNVQPFTIGDAITDANFWLIIALGFLVYVIFGIIFSHFNAERKKKYVYDNYENSLIEKINSAAQKHMEFKNRITNLESEIINLNHQLADLPRSRNTIFYSTHEVKKILTDYTMGWMIYLTNVKKDERDTISKIEDRLNNFLREKGLTKNE